MSDTVDRIAEQMPQGPNYGSVSELNRRKIRRGYRLFGLELPDEVPVPPESMRKWLNGSPIITSASISTQLVGKVTEKRLEQIRLFAFPDEKECLLLSSFFGGYKPDFIFMVVFRHHLKIAKRILRKHIVDVPRANAKRWNGRVLCLVDRQTAMRNRYPIFELRVNGKVMRELFSEVDLNEVMDDDLR